MRHPGNNEEWKEFDLQHPNFALEPRNVRLGLVTDEFNHFGNMNNYSKCLSYLSPMTTALVGYEEAIFYVVLFYFWSPSTEK